MTNKTAQFTPPDCPICRERHEANRSLSYDGRGINSCGMYRNRIATFQHSDDVARELGPKFAAALALYEALKALVDVFPSVVRTTPYGVSMDISKVHDNAKAALAQAEGW